jgi:hypothetical protein
MTERIKAAAAAGLAALARLQSADGSFPLWTGTQGWRVCDPLFSTAYIMLGAGRKLPAENVARALAFIRRRRGPDGLWEYDTALHLPPDSDSTSCALAALALSGGREDVAGGPRLLRSYWRDGSGPFRTWNPPSPLSNLERDDPVVNCNVVLALATLGAPASAAELAAVRDLLGRSVRGSRYYCAPGAIAHAASRAGLPRAVLPRIATLEPEPADLLGCAQFLCASPQPHPALAEAVLRAQRPDGSWPVFPWVTAQESPRPFWGSPAVTTALAIEALARHISAG